MATATRKSKSKNHVKNHTTKLPVGVTQQLEKIYFQSKRKVKKHPYKVTSGVLLTLGLASGTYFLIRYLNK